MAETARNHIFSKEISLTDNRSHGFGAKFLLKKLSASDFSYERKSAFSGERVRLAIRGSRDRTRLATHFENLDFVRNVLFPHIKFGGKIWGNVQPNQPNKRQNLGSSVTTRRKSWEKSLFWGHI